MCSEKGNCKAEVVCRSVGESLSISDESHLVSLPLYLPLCLLIPTPLFLRRTYPHLQADCFVLCLLDVEDGFCFFSCNVKALACTSVSYTGTDGPLQSVNIGRNLQAFSLL